MPCIPSYHEQMWDQSNLGIRVAREQLKVLVPLLELSQVVVDEALKAAPELRELTVAQTWRAKAASLLEDARRPDAPPAQPTEAQIEARRDEADRWRTLWRTIEEHVCEAGVLAFRAKDRVKSENAKVWKKVLAHHVRHREADRKAKLAELRKSVRALGKGNLDAARRVVRERGEFFDDVTRCARCKRRCAPATRVRAHDSSRRSTASRLCRSKSCVRRARSSKSVERLRQSPPFHLIRAWRDETQPSAT